MALFGALALVLLLGVCTVAASSLGNNSNPATKANANQNQDQNSNPGIGDYQIAGHTYDQSGAPISGVDIYIRIVPLSYGALYRTKTAADGSYSYKVPEGVYNVLARIGDPISTDLEPVNGSRDVSVPPGRVLDFQLR